jgi:hypothetical protein
MQYSQAGKASKMRCRKDSRNLSMDMQEITEGMILLKIVEFYPTIYKP